MAEQSRFRGPLVGFAFLESFIGVYPLLVPHPRCLLSLGATMRAQPGPLELVDTTGEACVRFRWWKIKPLGKDLEESASRLRGCDLVIRNDIWDDLVSKLKPQIVFETKVTERALKSGED